MAWRNKNNRERLSTLSLRTVCNECLERYFPRLTLKSWHAKRIYSTVKIVLLQKRSFFSLVILLAVFNPLYFYSTDALSMQVQLLIDHLLVKKYQLVLCWITGLMGIRGNELAHQATKDGILKEVLDEEQSHGSFGQYASV